jgi:hypothetical protein
MASDSTILVSSSRYFTYCISLLWTPHISTGKALRFMHTKQRATFGTSPFLFFTFDKIVYSNFPYASKVLDGTGSILRSIPPVQARQACTRKLSAFEAILNSTLYHLFAIPDPATDTGFRFESLLTPTTRTGLLVSSIGSTKATIDSTGGDQGWGSGIFVHSSR